MNTTNNTSKWWKGQDEWLDKCWADRITEEFAEWWLSYYGSPEEFIKYYESVTLHDYYSRMAFAFMGWEGRVSKDQRQHIKENFELFIRERTDTNL